MNYQLVAAIVKSAWAIELKSVHSFLPFIQDLFTKPSVEFEFDPASFQSSTYHASTQVRSRGTSYNDVPSGSIAILKIAFPLMKNDQDCGPVGMATIGQYIKEADKSRNIDGILLDIDSPGGQVDGTFELSEIIANTKKPIISFANGLMASAAYWIASSSDEIIAANTRTTIGSIGVLTSLVDMQPALEKEGVKFHTILAKQSKLKTKYFDEIRAGNYDNYRADHLDPIAADFISHVKSKRPGIKEEQLSGLTYFASDVVGSLVDSIGNFDFAMARLQEIIVERREINNPNKNDSMKHMVQLLAVLSLTELAITDDGVFLSEEQLDLIEAALPVPEETATEENAPEETASEETVDPRDAEIEQLQGQIAAFNAAAPKDKAVPKETDNSEATKSDDYFKNLSEAKEAMQMFEN